MSAPKLAFLVDVVARHPDPCYALPAERPAAEELAKLGILEDVDDKGHPGCFSLTAVGVRTVRVYEDGLSGAKPPVGVVKKETSPA